jgi:hypothetical protein
MIRRLSTAAIGCAFVCSIGSVQASPYFGFDGRHYGELQNAPNFGRAKVEHGKLDHADAPRKCLQPEIRALLEKVEDMFGPVEVISTCRPGATIAGTGRPSRHASGNAVDFEAGGRKVAILRWLVANNHTGGTMTYADMNHIHIDYGPHFVSLAKPLPGLQVASHNSSGSTNTSSSASTSTSSANSASRSSSGARYASSYARDYDGGSRRYAASDSGYSYASDRSYGGSYGNSDYRNGYATIYRQ